jgi:hypothetical protein
VKEQVANLLLQKAGCKPAPAKKKTCSCKSDFGVQSFSFGLLSLQFPPKRFFPFYFFSEGIVKEQVTNLLLQKEPKAKALDSRIF